MSLDTCTIPHMRHGGGDDASERLPPFGSVQVLQEGMRNQPSASFAIQEVVQLLDEGPVCPDSAVAVQKYLRKHHPEVLQGS